MARRRNLARWPETWAIGERRGGRATAVRRGGCAFRVLPLSVVSTTASGRYHCQWYVPDSNYCPEPVTGRRIAARRPAPVTGPRAGRGAWVSDGIARRPAGLAMWSGARAIGERRARTPLATAVRRGGCAFRVLPLSVVSTTASGRYHCQWYVPDSNYCPSPSFAGGSRRVARARHGPAGREGRLGERWLARCRAVGWAGCLGGDGVARRRASGCGWCRAAPYRSGWRGVWLVIGGDGGRVAARGPCGAPGR